MGKFLHALGDYAFRRKWVIVGGWFIVLAILAVLAMQFMKPTSDSISIPGTEAQKTLDRFGELFPSAGKGTGRIVFEASAGKTIADYKTQIEMVVTETAKIEAVSAAISPFINTAAISKDQTIAYIQVQMKGENSAISEATTDAVGKIVDEARTNNLTVEMGGDIIRKGPPGEILGAGEIVGVALALLVLVLTLGSLISAGMPIATALITIGVSMAGLFALSQVIDISSTTPVLAVMLGLAVGIDYSLFIISKYRNYLLEGHQYRQAAGKAIATAGNAVLFAAATVVIALSALTVVQIPFMTTMGLAGAATVGLASIVAVTLIPALLGIAGDKIFTGKTKRAIQKAQSEGVHDSLTISHTTFWYRWGQAITRRPIIILIAAVILVATIALPARDLTLGLPTDQYAATTTTERKAYDLLSKGFGVGFNGPLLVLAEGVEPVSDADKATVRQTIMAEYTKQSEAAAAAQKATFEARAAQVKTPEQYAALQADIATAQKQGAIQQQAALAQVEAQIEQYSRLYQLNLIAERIAKLDTVEQAVPTLVTDTGYSGVIQVTPKTAPTDPKTLELITYLRDETHQAVLANSRQVHLGITGSTALQADINEKLANALPLYLAVVVGLSLILLIIAFRSILIPIKATLGFLLSVLAMFGAIVAVFQWGWFGIAEAPGPIISFIPIIAIGVLFGLAMDYEFFLVSSMHEAYAHNPDAKKAVVNGFGMGSKVVTAAGVIMVAVFAGFIFNHDATIQAIGLGLALGIFVDAFIVRMTIVPAIMTLLGKSAWWLPRWLDRIVPHVSIEGEEIAASKPKK